MQNRTKDEVDLEWFFCHAPGALGLSGMPIEPSTKATRDDDAGISQSQLEAATKHRRIGRAITELSHEHQHVLKLAFSSYYPGLRSLRAVLGDYLAVVVDDIGSDEARELDTLARATGQKARRAGRRLRSMKASAERRVTAAIGAFGAMRRDIDRAERAARRDEFERSLCAAA